MLTTGLGEPVAGVQNGLETAVPSAQAGDRVRGRDQSVLAGRPALDLQAGPLPAPDLPQRLRQVAQFREGAGHRAAPQGSAGDGVATGHRDSAPARRAGQYRPRPACRRARDDLLGDPPRGPLNHVMPPSCRCCRSSWQWALTGLTGHRSWTGARSRISRLTGYADPGSWCGLERRDPSSGHGGECAGAQPRGRRRCPQESVYSPICTDDSLKSGEASWNALPGHMNTQAHPTNGAPDRGVAGTVRRRPRGNLRTVSHRYRSLGCAGAARSGCRPGPLPRCGRRTRSPPVRAGRMSHRGREAP